MTIKNIFTATALLVGCTITILGSGAETTTQADFLSLKQAQAKNKIFSGESNAFVFSASNGLSLGDDKQVFSIQKNSTGGYDATLNGEEFSFTGQEWDAAGKQYIKHVSDDETVIFWTIQEITGSESAYKYVDLIFAADNNTATKVVSAGFGVYGVKTETPPTDKTTLLTGKAVAFIANRSNASFNNVLTGDMSLTANFSTNKITGSIASITDSVSSTVIPGQINIEDGVVTHNSYNAKLSGSNTLNTYFGEAIRGKLQGGFYGENAEETGGKFTIASPNYIGVGGYTAKQE